MQRFQRNVQHLHLAASSLYLDYLIRSLFQHLLTAEGSSGSPANTIWLRMSWCVCVRVLFLGAAQTTLATRWLAAYSSCEFVYLKLTFIFTTFLILIRYSLQDYMGMVILWVCRRGLINETDWNIYAVFLLKQIFTFDVNILLITAQSSIYIQIEQWLICSPDL